MGQGLGGVWCRGSDERMLRELCYGNAEEGLGERVTSIYTEVGCGPFVSSLV